MSRPSADTPPLVSIVVPSYRQARFLRQCLASLRAQTYPALEVIVRDNLSDDGTAAVLDEARGWATVVREADRGQADALARGFRQARGQVFGWLNADDMLMPDAVASAVAVLEGPDRPDVVYGHCALLDEDGGFLRYFDDIEPYSEHRLRNETDFIAQPSTFFRRAAYDRVGGLDVRLVYAMDWDLWCRFARAGGLRFAFLPHVLAGARLHPSAKTARGGLARLLEITRVNLRHATRPVPMVTVLFLAHLYSERVKPLLGPLHSPLRRVWRTGTGRSAERKAVVHGLCAPARVVERAFEIHLPVYRELAGVRLTACGAGLGAAGLEVRLDGAAPVRQESADDQVRFEWPWERPRTVAALHLAGTLDGTPPPEADLALELISTGPHLSAGQRRYE